MVRLALVFVCACLPLVGWAAEGDFDELFRIPPEQRVQLALSIGDTRFIAIPECAASSPGPHSRDLIPQSGELEIDPGCLWVYGQQGAQRLRKFEQYAREFNRIMLEQRQTLGLFAVFPRSTQQVQTSPAEASALNLRGDSAFRAIFGTSMLASLKLEYSTLWKGRRPKPMNWASEDKPQVQIEEFESRHVVKATISVQDFNGRFPKDSWRHIPCPLEFAPRYQPAFKVDKETVTYLTVFATTASKCFVGQVNNTPAYILWQPERSELALVLALDRPRYDSRRNP